MNPYARKAVSIALASGLSLALAGCATSHEEQRAEQAEAAAARAQASAARAEEAANKATEAANKATIAADHATKVVEEATREINRVADHLDQLIKERDEREHSHRASHVSADKADTSGNAAAPSK